VFNLLKELLPAIWSVTNDIYNFQHDNAQAHRAHQTVELLRHEKPKFVASACGRPTAWTLTLLITAFGDDAGSK